MSVLPRIKLQLNTRQGAMDILTQIIPLPEPCCMCFVLYLGSPETLNLLDLVKPHACGFPR